MEVRIINAPRPADPRIVGEVTRLPGTEAPPPAQALTDLQRALRGIHASDVVGGLALMATGAALVWIAGGLS